mmetsp:Transcript_81889/g.237462  ORF Transcript_81889/g.237462 Transcript_81889/m.237462 type:complete len:212 (-) Transcript_81889:20-655(-)
MSDTRERSLKAIRSDKSSALATCRSSLPKSHCHTRCAAESVTYGSTKRARRNFNDIVPRTPMEQTKLPSIIGTQKARTFMFNTSEGKMTKANAFEKGATKLPTIKRKASRKPTTADGSSVLPCPHALPACMAWTSNKHPQENAKWFSRVAYVLANNFTRPTSSTTTGAGAEAAASRRRRRCGASPAGAPSCCASISAVAWRLRAARPPRLA